MKVLVAVHHFPPNRIGGAEWQAYRTASWLRENGHDVRVICVESDTSGSAGQLEYKDDSYDRIPVRRLFFNLPLSPDPFRWSFNNPLIERRLTVYLENLCPDLVYLISGYLLSGSVLTAAQSVGISTVLMPMDFWFLCPRITLLRSDGSVCKGPDDLLECALCLCQDQRRYRWLAGLTRGVSNRFLRRLWEYPTILASMGKEDLLAALRERRCYLQKVFRASDLVLSNSRFLKGMLTAHGFHHPRLLQIRQGIDTRDWVGSNIKTPSEHLRVGYIGQIARHKGVDVLIRAFRRLRAQGPAPTLTIYGDLRSHPRFARHLRRITRRDGRIAFAGTVGGNRVLNTHSELDLLVVPSVWYENSPNVILEAFTAGTPIVASDSGGMAELVQHEVNGLLFERGNVDDLARQLQRVVDQPALLESLRKGIGPVKTVDEEMEELVQLLPWAQAGSRA